MVEIVEVVLVELEDLENFQHPEVDNLAVLVHEMVVDSLVLVVV